MSKSEIYCFMTGKQCGKLGKPDHRSKKDKKIFALIPFKEPYFDYYKFAIKHFYLQNDFECSYGGESAYIDGEYVICKICEEIYKSSLIIADISDNNPNVYYELGIAHGLGKSTIAIVNKNIANESDQDILPFLSGKCDRIYYDGIYSLKCELSTNARKFPIFGNINSKEEENKEDRYSLICLIPKERKYERKIEKYAEVYKYGIKEALRNLEFPGDELGGLDKESVCNIIDEAIDPVECDVQNIINKISHARYCIIDITENGHQEVFYWLGFIHGLRVNPEVRLRSDLICLYITSGKMKELPFDIRAARIIYYNSIEDLNIKINKEIEQLEVARIKEYNKEKEKFWKKFNVKNTQFLIGALDSYPVGGEKETRNRISIQDFKAYNRIVYQLLFVGARRSFQYNLKELELSNFFENYKDSLKNMKKGRDEWEKIKGDVKINDNDEFKKLLLLGQRSIENIIIIGSSCVNPAAENIMRVIYPKKSKQKPVFKTFHRYKSRSVFWQHLSSEEEESGIYINNSLIGCRERAKCFLSKKKQLLLKDTALLI